MKLILLLTSLFCLHIQYLQAGQTYFNTDLEVSPIQWQMGEQLKDLKSSDATKRATAIENLSNMRAYRYADKIAKYLQDESPEVRREAAMNLGWCGNKASLKPLLKALNDSDWSVAQAAGISLNNLTGNQIAFDALAKDKAKRVAGFERIINKFDSGILLGELKKCKPDEYFRRADIIRAIGFMNVQGTQKYLISLVTPYLKKNVDPGFSESTQQAKRSEKQYAQALIRTLGRLGRDDAKAILIKFINEPQFAGHAAMALGDVGGEDVAYELMKHYPDYAISVKRGKRVNTYKNGFVKKFHRNDSPSLAPTDRIPRVSHDILQALCNIDFKSPKNIKKLQEITPSIISTMPSMFDATYIYEYEPYQMFARYLFEKCNRRRTIMDAAYIALKVGKHSIPDSNSEKKLYIKLAKDSVDSVKAVDYQFVGTLLMTCADKSDVKELLALLKHKSNWIKMDTAKTLMFMDYKGAIPVLIDLLSKAKDDASYGYDMDFSRFTNNNKKRGKWRGAGYDEYNDPSPRYKEAFVRALGKLHAKAAVPILTKYLNNQRNVVEIQYAAARALLDIATPEALEALRQADVNHPFASVSQIAREAVWRYNLKKLPNKDKAKTKQLKQLPVPEGMPKEIVFIRGVLDPGNHEQISSDKTGYSTTDAGTTYRLGNNIFRCSTANPKNTLKQLTHFKEGWVADIEVSYDGKRIIFTHNGKGTGPDADPWFHVYEMNADGSNLRQLTHGPYHDVQPNYMPDGRIVFSTTRLGMRDEYHGYPATGLAVMNDDGTDIHVIGFNLGRDAEPVIGDDGRILFTRLELFYSRMKTEWNLLATFTDGTRAVTIYGPERRPFWKNIKGSTSMAYPRHRALRMTQPQSWKNSQYLANSFCGPMLLGPGHLKEEILRADETFAVTTPYKIDDETLLVAAGKRPPMPSKNINGYKGKFNKVRIGKNNLDLFAAVDHGIYYMDIKSGKLTLIYDNPGTAEFEARPLQPHKIPLTLPEGYATRDRAFSGTVLCSSVYNSRIKDIRRGRYIRIVEGEPTVQRHQTQPGIAWRNHGGAVGRDWGIVPLATDGSFSVEVPSDRLFHIQVLDQDRNVIGNELIWQYTRPKESKSCLGCHETPDQAPAMSMEFPQAQRQVPIKCYPDSKDMLFRAKQWFKGWSPDEREERMHTVNSINIIGRM